MKKFTHNSFIETQNINICCVVKLIFDIYKMSSIQVISNSHKTK